MNQNNSLFSFNEGAEIKRWTPNHLYGHFKKGGMPTEIVFIADPNDKAVRIHVQRNQTFQLFIFLKDNTLDGAKLSGFQIGASPETTDPIRS